MLSSRLATRLGGGRLKIKKKVLKKRKNPALEVAPTNSTILQEKPQHHVIFNSKPTSATSIPADFSSHDLELKEGSPNENPEFDEEELQTTTVSVSTTSTVSSVSGIGNNDIDNKNSPFTFKIHPFTFSLVDGYYIAFLYL